MVLLTDLTLASFVTRSAVGSVNTRRDDEASVRWAMGDVHDAGVNAVMVGTRVVKVMAWRSNNNIADLMGNTMLIL